MEEEKTPDMPLPQKLLYLASVGIPSAIGMEAIGFGASGLIIASLLGGTAAFFSEEIREILHIGGGQASSNKDPLQHRLQWLVSGGAETEEDKPAKQLEGIEPLQPRIVLQDPGSELAAPTQAPSIPFFFSDVLKTFKPSLDKIYLATLPDGKHVFVPATTLCHTALAGATRGGKSQLIRQLMSQLCYAGAHVYLLDPNYTSCDPEAKDPYGRRCPEDWTPFDRYLKNNPKELIPEAQKYRVIGHYLKESFDLVNKRLELRGHSKPVGAPVFIVIDEVPAIIEEIPEVQHFLKKILREGAKVKVHIINASQDFQVKTIFKDVGGGIRQCYRTCFDVGADLATQKALELPVAQQKLGKGRASLRCDEIMSLAFVPFVDNNALYMLLGPSLYEESPQTQENDDLSFLIHPSDKKDYSETEALPTISPQPAFRMHQQSRVIALKTEDLSAGQPTASRTIYHSHASKSIEARRRERLERLHQTGGQKTVIVTQALSEEDASPESSLKPEELKVLNAYREGHCTGNAIAGMTDIPPSRVNQILHKLGQPGLKLIDWKPRTKV